jgi:hypothetical protein
MFIFKIEGSKTYLYYTQGKINNNHTQEEYINYIVSLFFFVLTFQFLGERDHSNPKFGREVSKSCPRNCSTQESNLSSTEQFIWSLQN